MTQRHFIGPNGNPIIGHDYITQVVLDRLLTVPGSRPLRPGYGAGVHDLLDRPAPDVLRQSDIIRRVAQAFNGSEFKLQTVTIRVSEGAAILDLVLETSAVDITTAPLVTQVSIPIGT